MDTGVYTTKGTTLRRGSETDFFRMGRKFRIESLMEKVFRNELGIQVKSTGMKWVYHGPREQIVIVHDGTRS